MDMDWAAALQWQPAQYRPQPQPQLQHQHQHQHQYQYQQQAYAPDQGVAYQTRGGGTPYDSFDTVPADLGSMDNFTMAGQDVNVSPANLGSHYTAANCYPSPWPQTPTQNAYPFLPGGPTTMETMGNFALQEPVPQAAFPQMAIPQVVNTQTIRPQVVNQQVVRRQVIRPQVVTPQTVTQQTVTPQMVNPQVVVQQAVVPQAPLQQYTGVVPAKRSRGRPKGARLHGDEPSGEVSAIIRVAWKRAEKSYGRLKKAENRLGARGKGEQADGERQVGEDQEDGGKREKGRRVKEKREKNRREQCVAKNQELYRAAVAEYQQVKTAEAEGRYDYLPATSDAEAKLRSLWDVLATRLTEYGKEERRGPSPSGQADAAGLVPANNEASEILPASLNKAEIIWINNAARAIRDQEEIGKKCRERDIVALTVPPLAVAQPPYNYGLGAPGILSAA
ncbi:hypothetical protein VMCG_04067 [Cytospora schulzeri]|uniref:Uncharacterized protein n=1 Tax=Cytospora schulzeri TaxID=448051 RepID=A0A423WU54_9PEZI|nr:hypothetical protein VMCG_04067 [Valsa malicola]